MANLPSTEQVRTEHNWVGSATITSILKPTIDSKEYKIWGNQNITGLFDMLADGKNPVSSLYFTHFEDNRLHTVVSATGTASGNTNAVTFTVVAPYIVNPYPASAVAPYLATGAQTELVPVRVGDTLEFPGNIMGTVIAVNAGAGTFDAIPDSSSVSLSLPTTLSTDEIIIRGVTKGEGSEDTTDSLNFTLSEYKNVMEIKTDAHVVTGSASMEFTWVTFTNDNGQTGNLWYYKGQADTKKRMENFRELSLVSGKKVTNTTSLATYDASLLKTEGLDAFAGSYGNTNTYNIVAGITLEDWNNIITDQIDKNLGATENSVWASIRLRNSIDGFIRPEMKNGGIEYGMFNGEEKQYVNFGFSSFMTLGYTNQLKTYNVFNNPTLLGAAGSKWLNYGWIIPASREMYLIGEKKEKTEVPSMRMNYVSQAPAGGSQSREWEEWLTGGTGGVYTNTSDTQKINFRSHYGFEGFGSKNYATLKGI